MLANNLEPYEPTHPGEVLRDEIAYLGLSQKALAEDIGVSYTILNDIVNGKRAVNTRYALLIEAALGIPAHVLVGLQADYDMMMDKRNAVFGEKLNHVRRVTKVAEPA